MEKYRLPPNSITQEQRDSDRRLSKVERLPRLPDSTVDQGRVLNIRGSFRVFDSQGRMLFECGDGAGSGSDGTWVLYRPDGVPNPDPVGDPYASVGSRAIQIAHTSGNDPTNLNDMSVWVMSQNGNPILAEAGAGNGLGVPYKHYYGCPTSEFLTPVVTTTSATYAPQWTIHGRYHHPKLEATFRVLCSDGSTAGLMRLRDSFSAEGYASEEVVIAAGTNAYVTLVGNFEQPSGYAPFFKYELDVLRNAGTGTIGTQLVSAEGFGDL